MLPNTQAESVLLKGGRVLNPAKGQDEVCDILIENGLIKEIGQNIPENKAEKVIQLTSEHWVAPGLVDIHVHFRDPGQSSKETTSTGTEAAIVGGFTTVCIMPNTNPVLDDLPTIEYVNQAAERVGKINIHPVCAISKGLAGEELTEMGSLFAKGAVGFTDDGHCVMNANLMRLALQYSKMFDVPIVSHAEDTDLSGHGAMNEGYYSTLLGLKGHPNVAESVIVARDIELTRNTGGRLHIAHVSTKESVALIRQAKAEGLKVTGETAPHYLVFTDANVQGYDPDFKMCPPLRAQTDQEALIEAILDGTLEAIATDHAPHTLDEKSQEFDKAPNGVIGLETSLGVMLTHFVHTGKMTPLTLIDRMSTGPARLMKLPAGILEVGRRADITIIDPNESWTVNPQEFKSKSKNCPFKGMFLKGRAKQVFSAGRCLLGEAWMPNPQPEKNLVTAS